MAQYNSRLSAEQVTLNYGKRVIIDELSLYIPDGKITVIIGPNACGKSTLLRSMARLLKPKFGRVMLDGEEIADIPTKIVAKRLGMLPQTPIAPQGVLVSDLVSRGRAPHQSIFQQWSKADEAAVSEALVATEISDLADRRIEELSGGQRQRVWIAMALAQQTELLLLDEPTTYLDLPHQIEVLNLVRKLNREQARTIVLVLHDLNLACRYADHIVAMREGKIIEQGTPDEVITAQSMLKVFELNCIVIADPLSNTPLVVPAVDG
ncbi:MAG: ABC transporter ATP-binding protein [Alphaproteobacteria bacterium]|nr:ABC transporter ATP-binding protein [Alphaproteobacteria bacterium]